MSPPRVAILVGLVLLVLLPPGCGEKPVPNILVVVVDTLRADRLGAYGNRRGLTTFMDELAKRGTVFRNAYAPTSWTCPSVASLLTSRYPLQHRVSKFESVLDEAEITFAEALRERAYLAAGFTANFRLTKDHGYAQGFQDWFHFGGKGKVRGETVRASLVKWLNGHRRAPQLLYLQYMEPHSPYEPPEPYKSRFQRSATDSADGSTANRKLQEMKQADLSAEEVGLLESLYDGEVAAVDAELRVLFGELERRGFLDHAIVVITADHGEEFREHGLMLHGRTLYEESVRVPLLLLAPGFRGGQSVDDNVSLIDLAPTILELVGLPPEPRFEGRSLVPLLERSSLWSWRAPSSNGKGRESDVILDFPRFAAAFDTRRHAEGLIRGSTKLLLGPGGKRELYDLARDPGETSPDSTHGNGLEAALAEALGRSRADRAKNVGEAAHSRPLDEATKEKLRALGYYQDR